ncbi:MAG: autotransporter outer membrane beta-barrel domain-containing protein, partial [Rhodospirillaceae bacterium]|nr:autotransporter outer membrane beta-barrel domain-containing protein [Rhodospirillaceae bacterium]
RVATGDRTGNTSLEGFDYDLDTFTLGVDKVVGSGWAIGLAATYGSGEINLVGGGLTDFETLMGSAYIGFNGESGMFIDLSGGISTDDYDTIRNTSFVFRPTANGKAGGTSSYFNAEVGYTMETGGFRIGPYAGVRYLSSDVGTYAETGAAMFNLTVLGQRASGIVGSVGLEIGGAYSSGNVRIVPLVRVAYETELDSIGYGASIQTSTGHIVGVGRGDDSKNRITANAGLALVGDQFSVSVSYQGTVDYSDGKDQGFIGRLSYSF